MVVRGLTWAALVALAVPAAAQPGVATAICGITGGGVADLRAKVAADPRFAAAGGDAKVETWSSEDLQAIWTFVTAKHPAFPAALCRQVVNRDGRLQIERELRCEGKAAACAAFDAEQKALEDGSGDGE